MNKNAGNISLFCEIVKIGIVAVKPVCAANSIVNSLSELTCKFYQEKPLNCLHNGKIIGSLNKISK